MALGYGFVVVVRQLTHCSLVSWLVTRMTASETRAGSKHACTARNYIAVHTPYVTTNSTAFLSGRMVVMSEHP